MDQFTLATGFREADVVGLEWGQIDIQRRVAWFHPDQTKSAKAIGVPLNDEALSILKQEMGKHFTLVFTYQGNPVGKAGAWAWRKVLIRASINNFRWHNLRHTWQGDTSLHILKELGGWASFKMVQRYAHLVPERLAL